MDKIDPNTQAFMDMKSLQTSYKVKDSQKRQILGRWLYPPVSTKEPKKFQT